MKTPTEEVTERLIEHLNNLTIDEIDLLHKYSGETLFTCKDNEAINLHLERVYEFRGNWWADFTESAGGLENYTYRVSDLLMEDQIELIQLLETVG